MERNLVRISGLTGNVSGLTGDISGLTGNVSGLLTGDISWLTGNVDECKLTPQERNNGVDIAILVRAEIATGRKGDV